MVTVDGWSPSTFRRVRFTSPRVVNHPPYKLDFLSDKVWPYMVAYKLGGGLLGRGSFQSAGHMFCHGDSCSHDVTSTTPYPSATVTIKSTTGSALHPTTSTIEIIFPVTVCYLMFSVFNRV